MSTSSESISLKMIRWNPLLPWGGRVGGLQEEARPLGRVCGQGKHLQEEEEVIYAMFSVVRSGACNKFETYKSPFYKYSLRENTTSGS